MKKIDGNYLSMNGKEITEFYDDFYRFRKSESESVPSVLTYLTDLINYQIENQISFFNGENFQKKWLRTQSFSFLTQLMRGEKSVHHSNNEIRSLCSDVLNFFSTQSVFELGSGAYPRNLMSFIRLGYRATACEIAPSALYQLKNFASKVPLLEVLNGSPSLSLPSRKYHVYLFSYVLHHYPKEEVWRFLASMPPKSDVLISNYSNKGWIPDLDNKKAASFFYPSKQEMKEMLIRIGYKIKSHFSYPSISSPYGAGENLNQHLIARKTE